jgi:ribonuclease D
VNLPPHKLVTTDSDWRKTLDRLQIEDRIAIDLEANSLFAYRERVCLIQISTMEQDYIIDPLTDLDLRGLGAIISDPKVEKVFHAAEYDLILLKRQYGWVLENLFDTMWASRILGYRRCGLANLLEKFYKVKLDKRHQKANWSKRPLPKNQLTYAQMDTHFLLSLRDKFVAELDAKGRMEEAQEIFSEQSHVHVNSNKFDPDSFWSITGVHDLNPRQQAIVKALHVYRDQLARQQNRPPFKVYDDRTVIELAAAEPKQLEDLPNIHGMSKGQIRRYGRKLLRVISKAQRAPAPKKPKTNSQRPPDEIVNRYERLRNWRKQRAQARGVESDVIISRDILWDLAFKNPKTPGDLDAIRSLGPWKRENYGDEILYVLHQV